MMHYRRRFADPNNLYRRWIDRRVFTLRVPEVVAYLAPKLHTRCATCGESSVHDHGWQAEVWADIHEFEHSRHRVRLFEQTRKAGLKEIAGWRDACA